jgi:hypothetical protein
MENQVISDFEVNAASRSRELEMALARWVNEGGAGPRDADGDADWKFAQAAQLQIRVRELHHVLSTLLAGVPVPPESVGNAAPYFSPRRARVRSPKAGESPPAFVPVSSAANDLEFELPVGVSLAANDLEFERA